MIDAGRRVELIGAGLFGVKMGVRSRPEDPVPATLF